MMSSVFIYALNDPILGSTRYVGQTANPSDRLRLHIVCNPHEKTDKAQWIRELLISGLTPVLEILDEVPESEGKFWEKEWIYLCGALGFPLTNVFHTRRKISRASRFGSANPMFGRAHSAETRRHLSESQKGRVFSLSTRAKMSAAGRGKKLSPAHRRALSVALTGQFPSKETREKMSEARKKWWNR